VGPKSLDLTVSMPLALRNKTVGLMGNFNGVADDDFFLPNGTFVGKNLTERQIFYDYAKYCKHKVYFNFCFTHVFFLFCVCVWGGGRHTQWL
jgi:hypothetical protein